jgi:NSS family neurotransmitter:Na+ symporter
VLFCVSKKGWGFKSFMEEANTGEGMKVKKWMKPYMTFVLPAVIIFPACFTFDVEPGAGPSLLFVAMAKVFNNMSGGRWWGSLFFMFMFFAAMSTIIAVCENILACVRELTGWGRKKACIICGIAILILSVPCALGFNLWSGFVPFASGSSVLDLEDFLVSNCLLPLGALCYVLFCVTKKGWGFKSFMEEANTGEGMKVKKWMKPYMTFVLPAIIIFVFIIGIINFEFADGFTILNWIKDLV